MAYRLIPLVSPYAWNDIIAVFGGITWNIKLHGIITRLHGALSQETQFKDTAKPKISPIMSLFSFLDKWRISDGKSACEWQFRPTNL